MDDAELLELAKKIRLAFLWRMTYIPEWSLVSTDIQLAWLNAARVAQEFCSGK